MEKGQVSVEFLVMLGISLVLITVLSSVAYNSIQTVNYQKENIAAFYILDSIESVAEEVYGEGSDSFRIVYLDFPTSYDPSKSYIENDSIVLNVRNSNYVRSFPFSLKGSLPQSAGRQPILVLSQGKTVYIGSIIFKTDRTALSLLLEPSTPITEEITITNFLNESIEVFVDKEWNSSTISFDVSTTYLNISPYDSATIQLTFNGSSGYNSGYLLLRSNTSILSQEESISIYAEVKGGGGGTGPLLISPTEWTAHLRRNYTSSKIFSACASETTITNFNISSSSGPPGEWISSPSSLGPIPAGSCIDIEINITPPENASLTTYLGNLTFNGDGHSIIVPMNITLHSYFSDINITNTTHTPSPAYANDFINISATATSANPLSYCKALVDDWYSVYMNADDGSFDSTSENISINLPPLNTGLHEVEITCYDSYNIPSRTHYYYFKVYKHILFLYFSSTPSTSEEEWVNYLASLISEDRHYISSSYVAVGDEEDAGQEPYKRTFNLDGEVWEIKEKNNNVPGFDIYFNFSEIPDVDSFNISLYARYKGSASHRVYLYLWNYSSSSWDLQLRIFHSNAFRWYNLTDLPSSSYLQNGVVQARILHYSIGKKKHKIMIDYAVLKHQNVSLNPFLYDVSSVPALLSGTVDESYYKVIMFAEWNNPDPLLKTRMDLALLNNHSLLFVGNAIKKSSLDFGSAGSQGGTEDGVDILKIKDNTHYITQPYNKGDVKIYHSKDRIAYVISPVNFHVLAEVKKNKFSLGEDTNRNIFYYGAVYPTLFTNDGANLAYRTISYAVSQSSVK